MSPLALTENREGDGFDSKKLTSEGEINSSQPFAAAELPSFHQRRTIRCVPTRKANIRDSSQLASSRGGANQGILGRRKKKRVGRKRAGGDFSEASAAIIREIVNDLVAPTMFRNTFCGPNASPDNDVERNESRGKDFDNEAKKHSPVLQQCPTLQMTQREDSPKMKNITDMLTINGCADESQDIAGPATDNDVTVISSSGLFEEASILENASSSSADDVSNEQEGAYVLSNAVTNAATDHHSAGDESTSTLDFNLDEEPQTQTIPEPVSSPMSSEEQQDSLHKQTIVLGQFPDVWDDNGDQFILAIDQAIQSRKGNSDVLNRKHDFGLAERNSIYDGPEAYTALLVLKYLDLYFRYFVFPHKISDDEFVSFEDKNSGDTYANLPRIQLFKSDRDVMMTEIIRDEPSHGSSMRMMYEQQLAVEEKLVDVWRDDVIACGVPSSSRLSPRHSLQRGFHGELVLVDGAEARVTESQQLLLCLSDVALYFLLDTGGTKAKSIDNIEGEERQFPSPIPRDARFSNACWPHAVARHPLRYLQRITIGFQFQRLILHFVLPEMKDKGGAFPKSKSDDGEVEFTYIIFTCNKLRTISLLQKFQTQLKDLKVLQSYIDNATASIDNDDRIILDGLAAAFAPNFVGSVLHYQILLQKWKNGDREAVRRVCILTDSKIFLLDECYVGDSSSLSKFRKGTCGDAVLSLVDLAELIQVSEIRAADEDPRIITLVIKAPSRLQRSHRWRLVCRNGENAERLIDDVRKTIRYLS